MERFEIIRGNDELAYYLKLGDSTKYNEIYAGVRLSDHCCPMCNWFFLIFSENVKPRYDYHERFHLLREHFNYHMIREYEEDGEALKNTCYGMLDCLVVYETALNRWVETRGHSKECNNRMDKKHHAVHRLIKEFGLPTGLVAKLLNKPEPRIGDMAYKGMLIATGGELPQWFVSAMNKT